MLKEKKKPKQQNKTPPQKNSKFLDISKAMEASLKDRTWCKLANFQWLSVHMINGVWPTEANGTILISRWFGLTFLSIFATDFFLKILTRKCSCHCSVLICLLNWIPVMQRHAPLEASTCKLCKKMQFCVLHRLAYLPTDFEQNWFRSTLKALPVPINHLPSCSIFAAATTYTPWALIPCFTPPKVVV